MTTTSPSVSSQDSACPVPFSVAPTHGISLISFPPPTKMLQFGGFPLASRVIPKDQEVPFSNPRIYGIRAPPRGVSSLVTTFIGVRAEPSLRWVVASYCGLHAHRVYPMMSGLVIPAVIGMPPPRGTAPLGTSPITDVTGCTSTPATHPPVMNPSACAHEPDVDASSVQGVNFQGASSSPV